MRILFVSGEYPPDTRGGIGSYVSSTAGLLAARGHEVHVLSCLPGQARTDHVVGGVAVHRRSQVPLPLRFAERSATVQRLRAAASVRRELDRLALAPDVVEVPDWMAESLFLRRDEPTVMTLHSPISTVMGEQEFRRNADCRLADRLESLASRRVSVVTCPSSLLADRLRNAGWTGSAVEIIPNPIDVALWQHDGPAVAAAPRVLATGRLEDRKAPEVLVEAAGLLVPHVPGLEVVLVGRSSGELDGRPYADALERRARALGVTCHVRDHVPRSELASWYAGARVVAIPSRFDNYPMAALEAMASGRPVVTTTRTGVASLVADLDPQAVVPPDDPQALAAALAPYLSDPARAAAVGAHARSLIMEANERALDRRVATYAAVARPGARKDVPA